MMDKESTHIIIAGSGGQGIVVVGNLIARALRNREERMSAVWWPYGAEMRRRYGVCDGGGQRRRDRLSICRNTRYGDYSQPAVAGAV